MGGSWTGLFIERGVKSRVMINWTLRGRRDKDEIIVGGRTVREHAMSNKFKREESSHQVFEGGRRLVVYRKHLLEGENR